MSKKNRDEARGVVFCCHGGSCTRAGARTVDKALRLHARECGLKKDLAFIKTACTGECKSAPIVIVCANPPRNPQVLEKGLESSSSTPSSTWGAHWKREVQPEQAIEIIDLHFRAAASPQVLEGKKRKKKKP